MRKQRTEWGWNTFLIVILSLMLALFYFADKQKEKASMLCEKQGGVLIDTRRGDHCVKKGNVLW